MGKEQNTLMGRKGLADRTALVVFIVSMLGVIIAIGVGVLVLAEFNTSANLDNNASTIDPAQQVFGDGLTMYANFTNQLGTIGTIGGILLLVVLVSLAGIGAYGYGRKKGLF